MRPRIFLSYARNDDEPFVQRLRRDLAEAEFDVWFDRDDMRARGLTFLQEIKQAIAERDRLVFIVGPKAATSPFVRMEWEHALACDKCVNPIIRKNDDLGNGSVVDGYALMPEELAFLHAEDFRDDTQYATHLANLIRQLSDDPPALGKLIGVPKLATIAPHFTGQSEQLHAVRDALLSHLRSTPVASAELRPRVGLGGMGGIGKSVFACVLACDRQVRESYTSGIFWLTFGQQPNLVQLQRNVANELGHEAVFDHEAAGRAKLRELLLAKAVLLICDDVWDPQHMTAFDVLGPSCRALITTRDAGLLRALQAQAFPMPLLTDEQAIALLAKAAGVDVTALPAEATEVARKCEHLPLALALCGGMALGAEGIGWADILDALRNADLAAITTDHPLVAQHASLWYALSLSVRRLTGEEQRRWAELAVFPEDETVPEAAVQTLWAHTGALSSLATGKLLKRLADRSLLYLEAAAGGDTVHRLHRVSLHDLLHDYARGVAGDPAALHGQMLEAYAARCAGRWAEGPDDGYFIEHLPLHLHACQRWDDLHQVVQTPRFACLKKWVYQGETGAALKYLPPLVKALFQRKHGAVAGAALATQLGRVHMQVGDYAAAGALLEEALHRLPFLQGWRIKAVAYHELGSIRLYQGDRDSAKRFYLRASWISLMLGRQHWDELAANRIALATLLLVDHESPRALALARRALSTAEKAHDYPHVVSAHRIMALAHKNLLHFPEAAAHLAKAGGVALDHELWLLRFQLDIDRGWLNYSRSVLERLPVEEAAGAFEEALRIADRANDLISRVEARMGLLWCYLLSDRTSEASAMLAATEALGSIPSTSLDALVKLGRAMVAQNSGHTADAWSLYEVALAQSKLTHEPGCVADALVGLGALSYHADRRQLAVTYWREAKAVARKCSPAKMQLVAISIETCQTNARATPR